MELSNKVELLETWVEDFSDRVGTWEEIKKIDSTGHFESDDEVGVIFTSIKETIEELNQYIEEETNEESSKKGSPRYYFTQKTEDPIIRYNKEERII